MFNGQRIIYLPGLNGIRAIAAIAVVLSHITLSLEDFGLDPSIIGSNHDGLPESLDLASYGVSMFFALSGFLITFLICKEKEVLQINVKNFYWRRILRIWPLYYFYFLICLLTYIAFNVDFNENSILFYLFYMANIPYIIGGTLPFLAHFWSLGVEEQFYIFWPWVCKLNLKQIVNFSLAGIIILVGLKTILHLLVPQTLLEQIIHVSRFHCMLIGALGALCYFTNFRPVLKVATNRVTQIVSWATLFLVAINQFHIASFLDNEIISVVIVVIILGQVTKTGIINFENKYFDFLGRISYGIYVYHPLLIFFSSKILKNLTQNVIVNYALVYFIILGATILISYLSYRYFEIFFLRIKDRKYSVVKSSGTMFVRKT
jgi:peptidoglycan/LPS O-acetylase OafA/YrhL